jgi:hypothetical protein
MPERRESGQQPEPSDEKMYTSVELTDEDGETYVVQQQNVGKGRERGGGEWPDPHRPAESPAPGSGGSPQKTRRSAEDER